MTSVLLIDNEPGKRNSLEARFHRNHDSTLNTPAEVGLEVFHEMCSRLIFSDKRMQSLQRVDALEKSKEIDRHACNIPRSGHSTIEHLQEAIQKGFVDPYLRKLWDSQKLIEAIDAAGAELNRDGVAGRIKRVVPPDEEGMNADKVPTIQQPF